MKKNWREKLWPKESKSGSAAGTSPTESPVPQGVAWGEQVAPASSATSATEATARESLIDRIRRQRKPTSAKPTILSGIMNTGWTMNPQKLVEQPSLLSEEHLPLHQLGTKVRNRLEELAEDIGCSPHEFIGEILTFYKENDHDIVECGTMFDLVEFYLDNEVII